MSLANRFLSTTIHHSRLVIAIMLVFTLVIGTGAALVDEDTSLDQFETDNPEVEKLEYIEEHFGIAEDNTTVVQIVVREENALSRESLISTLELQQDFHENRTINETLVADPFADLALVIAQTAMVEDRMDDLDNRADELDNESEELEADVEQLENESDQLENESEELAAEFDDFNESQEQLEEDAAELAEAAEEIQERQETLEADQAELDQRIETLQSALEETAGIQSQYMAGELTEAEADAEIEETWTDAQAAATLDQEQNTTFEAVGADVREVASLEFERESTINGGPTEVTDDPDEQQILRDALNETIELQSAYDGADTDEERAEINATIAATWDDASAAADLDSGQDDAFRSLGADVRILTAEINEIGPMPALLEAGTAGVLAEDISELETRGQELEADAEELEQREQEIEERGDALEERGDELAGWADDIESRGDELEQRGDELENRGQELEERGDELEADYEALAEIDPTPGEAIEYLAGMGQDEYTEHVAATLDEDADSELFTFLPTNYEPGSNQADARMLFVTQETAEAAGMGGEASEGIVESQLAMQSIVNDQFDDGFVFGSGVITDEMDRSLEDSLIIVLPLALLFVTVVLMVAYRDLLDIILGLVGIVLVLVWTFGFIGWSGMSFTIIMIAVPVLLVGLSVDYAIHVFMRHREQRHEDRQSTSRAMYVALGGVGVALIWVTTTAVIGFLSNLVSPIAPIREFGLAAGFGIASALLIFGVFVPALKLETDALLESRGFDRNKRAFGTGGGLFTRILSVGQRAADRVPWAVVVIALLLTAGGAVGASQVDTTFDQEDFLADDPPEWTKDLPGSFAMGDYGAKANLDYVNDNFLRHDTRGHVLIEGNVTDDRTLVRIDGAEDKAANKDSTVVLSDGSPDIGSPLTTMRSVADMNESFNETFTDADTTGDEVPDRNITGVYDALFEANEDAAREVIYRTEDGDYEAVQLIVSVRGGATGDEATEDMRDVAASIDGDGFQATATGQLIVFHIIESELFTTVLQSLLITLVAVFAFLMIGYRWIHDSAVLGAVTLLPIVFTVAWILGTMYLLGIPFNVMTGTITSLTVGLGIAYNIHMSERFMLERRRGRDVLEAMQIAVTGTGGALLGSAATTIGGFGVLMFAILPPLQQFGLITGLTILYAFLGSVFVLPSFLVLWSQYLGPPEQPPIESGEPSDSTAGMTGSTD